MDSLRVVIRPANFTAPSQWNWPNFFTTSDFRQAHPLVSRISIKRILWIRRSRMSRECRSARFPSGQEDLLIQSVDHFIQSGRSFHPVGKITLMSTLVLLSRARFVLRSLPILSPISRPECCNILKQKTGGVDGERCSSKAFVQHIGGMCRIHDFYRNSG